jgi:hypothetical protein
MRQMYEACFPCFLLLSLPCHQDGSHRAGIWLSGAIVTEKDAVSSNFG